MVKTAAFDAADYLNDEETIAAYLTAALEDPNPDVFLAAVRDVARARGMAQLAKDAGLGRESLYKALTPGAKPRSAGDSSSWRRALGKVGPFRSSALPKTNCGPGSTVMTTGTSRGGSGVASVISAASCPARVMLT